MANGLEREFPEVAWRAVPPIGPRGMSPEAVREHIARRRERHGRAIRDGARSARGAVARALVAMVIIGQDRRRGPSRRLPGASEATSAQGA